MATRFTSSSTSQRSSSLSIDQLQKVLDILEKGQFSPSRWFTLGIWLKLNDSDLRTIESNYKQDAERGLIECVALWLKHSPDIDRTWDTMKSALTRMKEFRAVEAIQKIHLSEESYMYSNKFQEVKRIAKEVGVSPYRISTKSGYRPPIAKSEIIDFTDPTYHVPNGNIAAIDFGTTSVSLAYTTKGDDEVNTMILSQPRVQMRVPHAILLKQEGMELKVVAIGNEARQKFVSEKRPGDYIYFDRMKEYLRNETVDRQTCVKSFNFGGMFNLVEVIAFILQHLKDLLIDHLSRTVKPMKATDFDWVITVPAIWNAQGRRMMREAAHLAGLLTESNRISQFTPMRSTPLPPPKQDNPEKLFITLEPEAAAYYCHEILPESARSPHYMVIDVGGGTTDITAHRIRPDGSLEVTIVPTGNTWGGERVDEAFFQLLQEMVKDPGLTKYLACEKHTSVLSDFSLRRDFEGQKISFAECKINEMAVSLPRKFVKVYDKALEMGAMQEPGIEYEDDTLYIEKEIVESKLFGPTIENIIYCVMQAIEDTKFEVDTFYLVGGFGSCKYVGQKVKAAIETQYKSKRKRCNVETPISPHLAVAQGAVRWRRNPSKVRSRRADATYAIEATIRPDSDKQKKIRWSFSQVLVKKDELISKDKVIAAEVIVPTEQNYTRVDFTIYAIDSLEIRHLRDKHGECTMKDIDKLPVNIPRHDESPEDQNIEIILDFSSTEIKVRIISIAVDYKKVCDLFSAIYT